MTWYRFLLSIFAILLLVVPADAEEASGTEEVERRIEALVERVMTEVLEQIQSRFEPQQMTWLGKTIKMEFKLEPLEKGDKPHSISVATKTYAINAAITTKISSFSFNVQGNLPLMEKRADWLDLPEQSSIP